MRYDTSRINVIVLAGGLNKIILFDGYVPGYKALLQFDGKPLIQYTLDALDQTREVRRVCIIGPVAELKSAIKHPEQYDFEPSGKTLIENITAGLHHFRQSPIVLVTTADLPLVQPAAVSSFSSACARMNAGYRAAIFWSMIPDTRFNEAYRQVNKGFNRFRDVAVCHGNLLLITPSLAGKSGFLARIDSIYKARKSSIRAALSVGPVVGLSYLLGVHLFRLLTLSQFAAIVSRSFGIGLIPVIQDDPDIAIDIDEARDYQFVREELNRRRRVDLKISATVMQDRKCA